MPRTKELGINTGIYYIYCPACECHHSFHTKFKNENGAQWTFNGDLDKPTFRPSMVAESNIKCHSFVTDGKIQYLADCQHEFKKQTLDLPEIE